MLNRRQVDVQFQNLATMCRMTVKSLIDYACVNTHVDEDCEEFVNFCAVFEQMVAHRIRPYHKKVWYRGQGSPRHFWEVMLDNHRQGPLFRSCIPNIEAIESIKSPKAKLRAFVRVSLMEKRLSDYLQWLQNNRFLMEECYLDGALFISEEGLELCGDIIGLSAIDFNFCLRGNENELLGPLEINYVPFLNYTQSPASRLIDQEEMLQLSGKSTQEDTSSPQPFNDDKIKLRNLERDFRGVKEQKDYLEELVRLRERQTGEATLRVEAMRASMMAREKEWEGERKVLDACVIELQDEICTLRHQSSLLKAQVSDLQLFKSRLEYRDVQMVDLAALPVTSNTETQGDDEEDTGSQALPMATAKDSSSTKQTSSDQKSILSGISDHIRLKEDTQSLVPLTGSLADVNIAMIRDNQQPGKETADGDWKRAETGSESSHDGSKDKDGFVDVELTLFDSHKNPADVTVASMVATTTIEETPQSLAPVSSVTSETSTSITAIGTNTSSSSSSSSSSTQITNQTESNQNRDDVIEKSHGEKVEKSTKSEETVVESSAEIVVKKSEEFNEMKGQDSQQHPASSSTSANENNSNNKAISHALQDFEKAFDVEADEVDADSDKQVEDSRSSCSSSNGGREDVNVSVTSDPEMMDKVNTSSEGSDATWEMLSDPDENDK